MKTQYIDAVDNEKLKKYLIDIFLIIENWIKETDIKWTFFKKRIKFKQIITQQ